VDIFRTNVSQGTALGRRAQAFMERGDLVPDEVTIAMVTDRLEDDTQSGFLLDGFPRTVPQAETLKKMLASWDTRLDVVPGTRGGRRRGRAGGCRGRRTCRRCGRVWHVLFDPPAAPGQVRRLRGRAVPAGRRPRRDDPAPARGLPGADRPRSSRSTRTRASCSASTPPGRWRRSPSGLSAPSGGSSAKGPRRGYGGTAQILQEVADAERSEDGARPTPTATTPPALLREHLAAGRLTAEEYHERLDLAYAAKTLGQLDELLADLPGIDLYELPDAKLRRGRAGNVPLPWERPGK